MGGFTSYSNGANGYFRFPNGLILQSMAINAVAAGESLEVTYLIPFPNLMMFCIAAPARAGNGTIPISMAIDAASVADFKKSIMIRNLSTIANGGTRIFALGR